MRALIPFIALLAFSVPANAGHHESAAAPPTKATISSMQAALAHPRRDDDRARDTFRRPAETLEFFKLDPGMTVIDYMPSSGWYTRVLVPFLGESGAYIGLNPKVPASAPERLANYFGGLKEKFPAKAKAWNLSGAPIAAYNTDDLTEEMDGTVDRVLIFREMHNLHRLGMLHDEMTRLFALLKDDGLLGIVQHRAKPWGGADYSTGHKGHLRQKDVIGLVEAHGFELISTSEINANAKDTADYPKGVWELPPVLRTKRDELKPIGESDRMTLLFRKRP